MRISAKAKLRLHQSCVCVCVNQKEKKILLLIMYLSQDSSFRGAEIEKKISEKNVILHQLLPRGWWHVAARSTAGQRNGHFHSVSRYPASTRGNIVQAFFVVARWDVVNGLYGASTRFLRCCVRVIRTL